MWRRRSETRKGGVWRAGGAAGICCRLLSSPLSLLSPPPPLCSLSSHNPFLPRFWGRWHWYQGSWGRYQQVGWSWGWLEAELGCAVELGFGPSVLPGLPGWRSEVSVTEDKRDDERIQILDIRWLYVCMICSSKQKITLLHCWQLICWCIDV